MDIIEQVLKKNDKAGELRQFPLNPLMEIVRWALDIHLTNMVNYAGKDVVREYVKLYFGLIEPGQSSPPVRVMDEYPTFEHDRMF